LGWTIEYTATAKRELKKMDRQIAKRILNYLDERVANFTDPRGSGKALTGPLSGLWRYRVGDCRIICEIQDEVLLILVLKVEFRGDVYSD
jgi:mRNA interferase RelE/StbE